MKKLWILGTLGIAVLAVTLVMIGGRGARADVPAVPAAEPARAPAATLVVTSTADSGAGTLRLALQTAVTSDTITFDLAVFPPSSPMTIELSSALPAIITDNVIIDASNAGVILDGNSTPGGTDGLVVDSASNVVIKGLQILYFPQNGVTLRNGATHNTIGGTNPGGSCSGDCNLISGNGENGVLIIGNGTMSNTVSGNFIGTGISGTAVISNAGVGGVSIRGGASHNLVGGVNTTPGVACSGDCNLISGNGTPGAGGGSGVWLQDSGTTNNVVSGNLIGTNADGMVAMGNRFCGVSIASDAQYNNVGGDTPEERNVISGNNHDGVWISDNGADHNTVIGNYVGTNINATAAIPNRGSGVHIRNGAQYNSVGGDTPGERNLISGNGDPHGFGVLIDDSGTMSNTVRGNFIGTDASGTAPLPNTSDGVHIIDGASYNLIGGVNATPGGACTSECNLISGNGADGVAIRDSGTMSNTVSGNYIGTDASGTAALGNAGGGVTVFGGAQWNVIGGDAPGEGNLISGNGDDGITIDNPGTMSNTVAGNYVGTDVTGSYAIPNQAEGISLWDSSSHTWIRNNLVSGNASNGIGLTNGSSYNTVSGNYIGTDVNGTAAVSNAGDGVYIGDGASYNFVGGSNATPGSACTGECNLISGNDESAVLIEGTGAMSNTVSGNYVGTDATGTACLHDDHNQSVYLLDGASYNLIGGNTAAERNLLGCEGVAIGNPWSSGSIHNRIINNYIGVDPTDSSELGGDWQGILLWEDGSYAQIISNTIRGFVGQGIAIQGDVEGVLIRDNVVSNNGSGNWLPHGIVVGMFGAGPSGVTISRNSVYSNTEKGIWLGEGTNDHMFPPLLTEVSNLVVRGIAVPYATIEVFSDDEDEGRWFHGSTTADASGHFTFTAVAPFTGTNVTATATDADGNTSEFSSAYTPSRDVVVAAIYAPQQRQQIDVSLTPLVRVGNGGTALETFTVTAVITRTGGRVYEDQQTVADLATLHYRTLSFTPWTPTTLGDYTFEVTIQPVPPDDDPSNDRLTPDFSVVDDRVDLWSRDNPTDDGREPSVGPVWQSPDLWVRNTADGLAEHQDPINNITNTVYVRIRNRGTLTATNATVTVYWHPPALAIGQSWWQSIGTVTVGEVASGAIHTAEMNWKPQITGVLTEPYHTCLIDVISSTQDPAPLWWDVRGSNNIEQRNVDIISPTTTTFLQAASSTTVSTTFSVGNPYAGEQLADVIVDATGVPAGSEVRLDLGELFERWQRFGQDSLVLGAKLPRWTHCSLGSTEP